MRSRSRIILAVDTTDIDRAQSLIAETRTHIEVYKFGLEFYLRHGISVLKKIVSEEEIKLFLDLKLHDIPNTVGKASASLEELDPFFLTVHASGGREMITAAVSALPKTQITAVTVLTSLDGENISELGFAGSVGDTVENLARVAVAAGARALVASPHEIVRLRKLFPNLTLITPGIRPSSEQGDDQRRIMTPQDAVNAGSDYLVIGRPITAAQSPAEAAKAIYNSIT